MPNSYSFNPFTSNFDIAPPILASGSIVFSDGTFLSENNANFFWDNTNTRLGIGTNAPTSLLHIAKSVSGSAVTGIIENTSATVSSDAHLRLRTANSGGNPHFIVSRDAAAHWSFGLDASASDAFKIASSVNLATSTRLSISSAGVVNIPNLTASLPVKTDASDNLISGAINLASSEVSGVLPVANGGTGTGTAFTLGSVVFAGVSGVLSQDNSNFFWDNTNKRLGISSTPQSKLHVSGTVAATPVLRLTGAASQSGDYFQILDSSANTLAKMTSGGAVTIGQSTDSGARLTLVGGVGDSALITLSRPGTGALYSWALAGDGLSFSDDFNGAITANMFGDGVQNQLYLGQRAKGSAETRTNMLSAQTFGSGAGADVPGQTFFIAGAGGTGSAVSPNIQFQTADATTSGTTVQNRTTKMTLSGTGQLGIGTITPNASSILDITSTTKGVLLPRMTTTQINAIAAPVEGLEVYDTTLDLKYYYNGTVWTPVMPNPMTTGGDLIYGGAAGIATRLANGTAGQYLKSNGGTAAPSWVTGTAPQAPTKQVFLSGSGTYTTPAGVQYLRVRMIGGGAGGAGTDSGSPVAGSTGGNTTFGTSLLTANGGVGGGYTPGAGGTASVITSATVLQILATAGAKGNGCPYGANASVYIAGGAGASTCFGGGGPGLYGGGGQAAVANTGAGGGAAGTAATTLNAGSGGSAGGFVEAILVTPNATYAYAVGSGGAGGTGSAFSGGNGGSGIIIVEEYYS